MTRERRVRMLFVCAGNTCRSPMAAGLAQKMFGDMAVVESAGIADYGESATDEAIEIMNQEFGIDISGHRPRSIDAVSLARFDCIVAIGTYIYDSLKERISSSTKKLICWDVDDPHHRGIEAYRACAREIHTRLESLASLLKFAPDKDDRFDDQVNVIILQSPIDSLDQLGADVARWQGEFRSGKLRGTLLHGIASKAVSRFEILLRDLLQWWLSACAIDYDQELKHQMEGKSLEQLTMGQTKECLVKLNQEFTSCWRARFPELGYRLRSRRLLIPPEEHRLNKILNIRKKLYHHGHYDKKEAALRSDTESLLSVIRELVAAPLFQLPMTASRHVSNSGLA